MGTFTTKLQLGGKAFGVSGWLDYHVIDLTVGQIRITQTHPKVSQDVHAPVYLEEYMCLETGVGSGTIWAYGKNIFADYEDAQRAVVTHQQEAYKQRAERDARVAKQAEEKRARELDDLARLKAKYECA